jgi:hypothetical protein
VLTLRRCLAQCTCTKWPAAQASCITAADTRGSQQKQQLPSPTEAACRHHRGHTPLLSAQPPSQQASARVQYWPQIVFFHLASARLTTSFRPKTFLVVYDGRKTKRCIAPRGSACQPAAGSLLAGRAGRRCYPVHHSTSGDMPAACCTSAAAAHGSHHMSAEQNNTAACNISH